MGERSADHEVSRAAIWAEERGSIAWVTLAQRLHDWDDFGIAHIDTMTLVNAPRLYYWYPVGRRDFERPGGLVLDGWVDHGAT